MRIDRLAAVAMILGGAACAGNSSSRVDQASRVFAAGGSQGILGRWALVSLMRNGEDRTNAGNSSAVRYYTFNEDGTFRITRGDSVLETGTWSQDTTVVPKGFDHIPNVNGRPGRYIAGIFAITGDTLRIAIIPPNPGRRRPTQFRSAAEDGSWLLVYHRAAR